ncbi:MAG TPA: prepilin-type N-terminal cleavage/methylation domain-containing protein, partial [Thermoanaerobaculia bacterium]|nr:prepilin-type N-terminal cleavage/methylation domain-containing protein [Thermoanaerobaculia bacterium]
MSAKCRKAKRRGFTLVEAMISLALIVVVLGVVLSLMFQMRAFAERQQLVTQPRQSARRALDYLGFFVEGASDVNPARNNPNAIVTYWENSNQAFTNRTVRQSSYNNLTGAETGNAVVVSPAPYTGLYTSFGDAGTDVITLAIPTAPIQIPVVNWPGNQHAANFDLDFRGGCPDDTANMNQFQQMTNSDFNGNQAVSGVLQFVDANGTHAYVQFTQYLNSD